jgi:hypothetical protein
MQDRHGGEHRAEHRTSIVDMLELSSHWADPASWIRFTASRPWEHYDSTGSAMGGTLLLADWWPGYCLPIIHKVLHIATVPLPGPDRGQTSVWQVIRSPWKLEACEPRNSACYSAKLFDVQRAIWTRCANPSCTEHHVPVTIPPSLGSRPGKRYDQISRAPTVLYLAEIPVRLALLRRQSTEASHAAVYSFASVRCCLDCITPGTPSGAAMGSLPLLLAVSVLRNQLPSPSASLRRRATNTTVAGFRCRRSSKRQQLFTPPRTLRRRRPSDKPLPAR